MIKLYATVLREEARHDGEYVLLENGIHRCWMTKDEFSAFQIEPPKSPRRPIDELQIRYVAPEVVAAPAPVAPVQVQSRNARK